MLVGKFSGFEVELRDPGIALITFNEPHRLNGFTAEIKRDLVEVLTQAQMHDDARVVVITGEGRAFCAGDDLRGYAREGREEASMPEIPHGHRDPLGTYDGLRAISQAVNRAVRDLDKLTVAAINGVAIQTGFSLALACDFRIAARTARMGSATLRFGLLPDEGGQWLLVQHLGVARTLEFLMRKRIIEAPEALALGLVHEVVEPEKLMDRALEFATELANGPQLSMRLLKRSVYNAAELAFDKACDEIAAKTAISDHHPDAREGVRAWFEKREPLFNQQPEAAD